MKAFVMDVSKCSGCYTCQIVCKDEHCGNDWTPYAKPQPETGQFWGKVTEYVRGQYPQGQDGVCVCAVSTLRRCPLRARPALPKALCTQRPDGLVIIDPKKCTGCRKCVDACPYGAIYYNPQSGIAQKCTGCAHLVDARPSRRPAALDCLPPWGAQVRRGSRLQGLCQGRGAAPGVWDQAQGATIWACPSGSSPERCMTRRPRKWSSARQSLSAATAPATATTDDFGDFWFDGLKVGKFTLKIDKDAKTKTIASSRPIRTSAWETYPSRSG